MRASVLALLFCLGLFGCSSFGSDRIESARVQSVTVEALPFDRPWDGTLFGTDSPDVYVDLKNLDARVSFGSTQTVARTIAQENTTESDLPLRLAMSDTNGSVSVDDDVLFTVNDRDGSGGDDLMFRTDTLRLASAVRDGDSRGTERVLTFENLESRIQVRVRWE